MSELSDPSQPRRRRRADAKRSIAAVLDAAAPLLTQNPHASVDDIARAAGLTRQTVYAHFPSRAVLLEALTDRATKRILAALEVADLDNLPAGEALMRLVEISWAEFEAAAFLVTSPAVTSLERERDRHEPIRQHLDRLIERGQRDDDFDSTLPAAWIAAATIALGHAAGEQVRTGDMTMTHARTILATSLSRLFTPDQ
ncbi:MAG: TetR/AcrR family transcriptional regulator [Nocardioidaceae bacterium]